MKFDIILCGVGGQGILFLSSFLIASAHQAGLYCKQSEVHGMAQRGGSVFAHLRLSDHPVFSPIIPFHQADMIISMEPLEVFRYRNYMNSKTTLIVGAEPVKNIDSYPNIEILLDLLKKANALVIPEASNIMLAGAASRFIPIDSVVFDSVLDDISKNKPQQAGKNKIHFQEGKLFK